MLNQKRPKDQGTRKRRRSPDHDASGRFKKGNKAAVVSKMNHLLHGKAAADRLARDVRLHGRRSGALSLLLTGSQPWQEALHRWREEMVNGNGGWPSMTPLTHEILSMACVMKVVVDSIGDYATKTNPVNKNTGMVRPIVESLDRLMESQVKRLEKLVAIMAQAKRNQDPSLEDLLNEPQ